MKNLASSKNDICLIAGSGLFVLVHTSNKGSQDIQEVLINRDLKCYEHLSNILKPIIEKNNGQSGLSSIGIVSGATYKEQAISLRKTLPSAPFLIPGYGAQGASASEACAPLIKDLSYPGLKNFGLTLTIIFLSLLLTSLIFNPLPTHFALIFKNFIASSIKFLIELCLPVAIK